MRGARARTVSPAQNLPTSLQRDLQQRKFSCHRSYSQTETRFLRHCVTGDGSALHTESLGNRSPSGKIRTKCRTPCWQAVPRCSSAPRRSLLAVATPHRHRTRKRAPQASRALVPLRFQALQGVHLQEATVARPGPCSALAAKATIRTKRARPALARWLEAAQAARALRTAARAAAPARGAAALARGAAALAQGAKSRPIPARVVTRPIQQPAPLACRSRCRGINIT